MTTHLSSGLAEVFGFPVGNRSDAAQESRKRHWCPFTDTYCSKQSRLLDFPFGVCSVQHGGDVCAICPKRFEERSALSGAPRVLEELAQQYFGDTSNIVAFPEVGLPNVGTIDYVLVQHAPMKPTITDFVMVEFQTDSTTGTGAIVRALRDFMKGRDLDQQGYRFGMNTYDTIKRFVTQLLNKGIVYEAWGVKCFWVIEEYIYANLVRRYGMRNDGYAPGDASRFALYSMDLSGGTFLLTRSRYVSITVDAMYEAMRTNPGLPDKDRFIQGLNNKLRAQLGLRFS